MSRRRGRGVDLLLSCLLLLAAFSGADCSPFDGETLDMTEEVSRDDDKAQGSEGDGILPHSRLEHAKGRVWKHPKIKVNGEWRDDTTFENLDELKDVHATRHERYFGRMNERAKKRDQVRAKVLERRARELEAEARAAGEIERIRRMKAFQDRAERKPETQ